MHSKFWLLNLPIKTLYGVKITLMFSNILLLHCTNKSAALEVSLPTLLLATHRYSPLSVLLTFVIVNCFLSSEKLILALLFTGDPPLVHDIVGTGFPSTLQDKVTLSPSILVLF